MSDPSRGPTETEANRSGRRGGSALGRDEERRLLDESRAGDVRAYTRLVRAHQDRIYGLVMRLVRDADLAEELTQDAFLRAHRGLGSFRGDARFATWVYRIALNLCRDHQESPAARLKRKQASLDAPGFEHIDPEAPAARPDESVEWIEAARDFDNAVRGLEPKYREAFLLRHQEGLGYDEISRALEITVSNAKVRVHRARELVLTELRGRGHEV